MRIPSGVTDQYVYFVGVDATDFTTRETGLSSFTVYRSRNGGAAAAMTTPTINETDATNMPGVYELLLDEDMTIDAGDDEQEMVFHITHAGMAPITRAITLFRPKITAGNTLGVAADGDVSGNVDGAVGSVTGAVGSVTGAVGSVTGAVGSVAGNVDGSVASVTGAVGSVTAGVTVSTNNDKAGYTISGTKTTLDDLRDIAATEIVSGGAITTSGGAVSNVTTVATTTTNSDMRGTDGANTIAPDNSTISTISTNVSAIQTILTGITSLANWLRAMVRSDTADSQAKTEINNGAGDFDEATDSQEALRDRGDAAWTTGSGGDASAANQTAIIGHLTDIKGGTFAGGTDSLEAIRDRGDAAWTTGGSGSIRSAKASATYNSATKELRILGWLELAGDMQDATAATLSLKNDSGTELIADGSFTKVENGDKTWLWTLADGSAINAVKNYVAEFTFTVSGTDYTRSVALAGQGA